MAHVSNSDGADSNNNFRIKEMRYLTRSIVILALLTGLIYIRVVGMETAASVQENHRVSAGVFLFGLLILAMVGLVCGWRWELIGGLIAVISAIGIALITYFNVSEYPLFSAIAYSSPFFIAGILMLACWQRAHTNS